jgi:hypothetical protein
LNIYCSSYRSFFDQCLPRLRRLASLFRR